MILQIIDVLRKALNKGFFHLLSASYIVQFFGFLSLIIVSKLLTPQELGAVKVIQSYVDIMIVLSSLGLSSAVLKFCAEDGVDRLSILQKSLVYGFAGSIIGVLLLLAFCTFNSENESELVVRWLPMYSIVIIAAVLTNIHITYLQATKQFKKLAFSQSGLKLLTIIIIVFLTYTYGISGYICGLIFSFYITVAYFFKQSNIKILDKFKTFPIGFLKLAVTSMCANVVGVITNYVDVLMLNYYVMDTALLGLYAIATIFLMIGRQFVGVVQSFLTPFFSNHSNDGEWVQRNAYRYQLQIIIIISAISLGIYLLMYTIINFYFGDEYLLIIDMMPYLLLQLVFYSSYAVIGSVLLAINHNKYNVYTSILHLLIKITVLYFLLKTYGFIGLLFGQVLAELPVIIIEWYYFKKTIKEVYLIC
mgnify:FL=1